MDSIFSRLLEWTAAAIESISETEGLTGTFVSLLGKEAHDFITQIMTFVMLPIADVILMIYMMLELQKVVTSVNSSGGGQMMMAEQVFKVLLRAFIYISIINSIPMILNIFYDISVYLSQQIADTEIASGMVASFRIDDFVSSVLSAIATRGLSLLYEIVLILIAFLTFLVAQCAKLLVWVMMVMRSIELYIMMAVSPIPLSMIPGDSTHGIGLGFLKRFGATCIQGTIISVTVKLFPLLINTLLTSVYGDGIAGEIEAIGMIFSIAGLSVILILCIAHSSKWAKNITGLV